MTRIKDLLLGLWLKFPEKWKLEVVSFSHTFFAILIGEVVAAPALNFLLSSDLPNISDWQSVRLAFYASVFRSLWKSFWYKFLSPIFNKK